MAFFISPSFAHLAYPSSFFSVVSPKPFSRVKKYDDVLASKNPIDATHKSNVAPIYLGPNAGNGFNPHGVPSFKKKEKFDYGKIQKAIEDNQNLSNGEKEIINKLKFVFDENYEYMDLDLIIKRLSDLKIEYIEEENENSQVTAAYYINKNVIQIYKATDLENADLTDLVHEILHVFQASNTNRLTLELSNELTTREVLRRLNEEGLIEENYQFLNSINEYSNYGKG